MFLKKEMFCVFSSSYIKKLSAKLYNLIQRHLKVLLIISKNYLHTDPDCKCLRLKFSLSSDHVMLQAYSVCKHKVDAKAWSANW